MHLHTLELSIALVLTLLLLAITLLTTRVYRVLHKLIKLLSFSLPAPRSTSLILPCTYCSKKLTEPEMYAFRGWVGCEQCVRDYYRDKSEQEMQFQLRRRQANARIWVTQNHKVLATAMARKAA
jgi:hypothetical protein